MRRPSPALLVAITALVLALGGAAAALPGKRTVRTDDIKHGAITQKLVARGAIGSPQIIGKSIKGNRLKDGAIRDKQVAEDGLTSSRIADYKALPPVRVPATSGATLALARVAAPPTELFSKGGLTVYAKCLRDTGGGVVAGEVYAKTATDGAILFASSSLPDDDATLLDTTSPEASALIDAEDVPVANAADVSGRTSSLQSAEGVALTLIDSIAVKQGTLPGGDGAFGAGHVCLFGLDVLG